MRKNVCVNCARKTVPRLIFNKRAGIPQNPFIHLAYKTNVRENFYGVAVCSFEKNVPKQFKKKKMVLKIDLNY